MIREVRWEMPASGKGYGVNIYKVRAWGIWDPYEYCYAKDKAESKLTGGMVF